jgi:arylsulfatase
VIFLSDNGPEGSNPLDWGEEYGPWAIENFDLALENLGRDRSYAWTGPGWATVSATPFALMKGFPTEGGTRVPAIMRWPSGLARSGVDNEFAHVLDLSATLLDVAGASHPGTKHRGFGDRAPEGRSMLPYLTGYSDAVGNPSEDVFVWEILGLGAVRQGDWKLVTAPSPWGAGHRQWSLYNLAQDLAEQKDVIAAHPKVRDRLLGHWQDYVQANRLILLDEPLELPWTMPGSHYDWMPSPASLNTMD